MPVHLAAVAETGFIHSLTPYKIVRHFFMDLPLHNQVKILFLESVTFQLYDHMLSSQVAQSFVIPCGRDGSQSSPCLFLRTKEIHLYTASERMTRLPVR